MAIAPLELPVVECEEPLENPWPQPVLRLLPTEHSGPCVVPQPPRCDEEPPGRAGARLPAGRVDRSPVRRRRRTIALGSLLAGALVALALPVSAIGGRASAPSGTTVSGGGPARTAEAVYVVRPGDTLSSIATRLDPHDSAAAGELATAIETELGTSSVSPGEQIVLP